MLMFCARCFHGLLFVDNLQQYFRSSLCTLCFHVIPVIIFSIIINIPKFFESKVNWWLSNRKISVIDGSVLQVAVEDGFSWIDVTDMRKSFEYTVYYQHWTRWDLDLKRNDKKLRLSYVNWGKIKKINEVGQIFSAL